MPVLWPYLPTKVSEDLLFNTSIRETKTQEIRDSLQDAVQTLKFDHFLQGADISIAEFLLRSNLLGEWYVPVWQDMTRFVGAIGSTDTVVTCSTDAGYIAGGKAIVFDTPESYSLIDIDTVGAGQLNLTGTVGANYTGTVRNPILIVPVVTGIALKGLTTSRNVAGVSHNIAFRNVAISDFPASSYPQHDGIDVLTDAGIVRRLTGDLKQAYGILDNGVGSFEVTPTQTFSRKRGMIAFAENNAWSRRQWLYALRGRDTPFWVPTWERDLVLTAPIGASDTSITVQQIAPVGTALVGRSIQIDNDGTYIHREITGATDGAGTHTLDIAATGEGVPITAEIGFMTRSRLDVDLLKLSHDFLSDGFLTRFNAPFIEVPA